MFEVTTRLKRRQGPGLANLSTEGIFLHPDSGCVEGALVLRYKGQELLGDEHWDDVDCLWGYLADGLQDVRAGRPFTTHFPDQPVRLTIAPSNYKIAVEVDDGRLRRIEVPNAVFWPAIIQAGREFFETLESSLPGKGWTRGLKLMAQLEDDKGA